MANRYFPSLFGRGDDPFRSLFQEVQKTFEDFSRRTPFARFGSDMLSPKIDVSETKDAVQVTAELPGVDESDVEVTLEDDVLTIRGEKKSEREEEDKDKNWTSWNAAMARSAGRSPCRLIPMQQKSRRSLIRVYCAFICQSRPKRQKSNKRSQSRRTRRLSES